MLSQSKNKILFVGNYAGQSGAPLRLLEIALHLNKHLSGAILDVLLIKGGTLLEKYKAVFNRVYVLNDGRLIERSKLLYYLKNKVLKTWYQQKLYGKIERTDYDLIYSNSVACINEAVELKKRLGKPLLLHVRELDVICLSASDHIFDQLKHVDRFIAISKAVRKMLIERFEIAESKIDLIYSGTKLLEIQNQYQKDSGAGKKEIIIGGCGTVDWRKGVDIFILTASKVLERLPQVKFVWLGSISKADKLIYNSDLKKLNIQNSFQFIEEVSEPLNVMKNWHLFLATAREEALGVACLEAGAIGIPLLAFDQSGGTAEIIENGGGRTVSYFNIDKMADAVCELIVNEDSYEKESKAIAMHVKQFDTTLNLPKILATVQSQLS